MKSKIWDAKILRDKIVLHFFVERNIFSAISHASGAGGRNRIFTVSTWLVLEITNQQNLEDFKPFAKRICNFMNVMATMVYVLNDKSLIRDESIHS